MDKAIVKINGKEYEIRFTAGFWRRIKASCEVTETNIEQKLREDFGIIAPQIILEGIIGFNKPTLEEIEENIDRAVMDILEQAVINSMPRVERELYDLAMKKRAEVLRQIIEKTGSAKE